MTEAQIQNALYEHLLRKAKLACPNYTTPDWWEADLWVLSPAGYATEYEVKCTKADFKNDALKTGDRWAVRRAQKAGLPLLTKHQRLEQHDPKGPSRFYFVCPRGLITEADLPPWAGLIEIGVYRGGLTPSFTRLAPQLHRQKVQDKVINHCRSVFYYRFWNLRIRTCKKDGSGQTCPAQKDRP